MDPNVREGIERLLVALGSVWICVWAYVGWRAYSVRKGATSYAATVSPGGDVPAHISELIALSTEWLRISILLGGVPIALLAAVWLYRVLKRRSEDS